MAVNVVYECETVFAQDETLGEFASRSTAVKTAFFENLQRCIYNVLNCGRNIRSYLLKIHKMGGDRGRHCRIDVARLWLPLDTELLSPRFSLTAMRLISRIRFPRHVTTPVTTG
jgi:hypothetical protein